MNLGQIEAKIKIEPQSAAYLAAALATAGAVIILVWTLAKRL
jgi:hypothetical protein